MFGKRNEILNGINNDGLTNRRWKRRKENSWEEVW